LVTTQEYGSFLAGHVADLLSILMILVILSGRREARATLGWLLLVIFLPYVGAALYLVLGRRRPSYPLRVVMDRPHLDPDTLPPAMALTQRLTGLGPTHYRDLRLLKSAEEKYAYLFADITAAKHRVYLCYYVFRRDPTGHRLLELLAAKSAEGLDVRLLYDGWGSIGLALFGGLRRYRRLGLRVEAFGRVLYPLAMSRVNFRNHRKIAVIDGEVAFTGSTNIGDEYLGISRRYGPWNDLHVRVAGEAAQDLERVFLSDWFIATGERVDPSPPVAEPGDTLLHVVPTGPDLEQESLHPLLFAQLSRATRSIDLLTPYLVPNQALLAALSVAARQGVRVRVALPQRSNHPMVAAAGRSYYEELMEGGVEIHEMPGVMLHAKGIIVDGAWAMLGSANFDNRSFFLNFEINLALCDPRFVAELTALFESWLSRAQRPTMAQLRARPLRERLFDAFCRTLSPVL
jgi:cardiolipin synthase